jgi:hypothetical protein
MFSWKSIHFHYTNAGNAKLLSFARRKLLESISCGTQPEIICQGNRAALIYMIAVIFARVISERIICCSVRGLSTEQETGVDAFATSKLNADVTLALLITTLQGSTKMGHTVSYEL